MYREEMMEAKMEHMMEWFKSLPEDTKKAVMKAKSEKMIKILQAKMDFLKEMQKIFG